MGNLIGAIFPASICDMYHAIKYCDKLKDYTGDKWSLIVDKGRLIYTIDYPESETENVDKIEAYGTENF